MGALGSPTTLTHSLRIQKLARQLSPEPSSSPSLSKELKPHPLDVRPLEVGEHGGFGAEVLNLDLRTCDKETVTETLAALVRKWSLVVVRGGHDGASQESGIRGERHAEITQWLSPSDSLYIEHQMHEEQHTPVVFRLSNNAKEGVLGGGPGLWHHDSLHLQEIPPFAVYHMYKAPSLEEGAVNAATWFARADASKLEPQVKDQLLHLYALHLPTGLQRPLLNTETDTMLPPTRVGVVEIDDEGNPRKLQAQEHRQVMEFYQRLLLTGEVSDLPPRGGTTPGTDKAAQPKYMNEQELASLSRKFEAEGLAAKSSSIYRHVWQPGDVIITHNPSVAHRAPTTEERDRTTGLRVLHRCLALA